MIDVCLSESICTWQTNELQPDDLARHPTCSYSSYMGLVRSFLRFSFEKLSPWGGSLEGEIRDEVEAPGEAPVEFPKRAVMADKKIGDGGSCMKI